MIPSDCVLNLFKPVHDLAEGRIAAVTVIPTLAKAGEGACLRFLATLGMTYRKRK